MITVLKALGNAGHKMSVKRIMDFLPNVGANTQGFKPSASVMIAAVQSLRLIAARDPDSVRGQRSCRNDGQKHRRPIFNPPVFRSRTSPSKCSHKRA